MKLKVTDKFSRQFRLFHLFAHCADLPYDDLNTYIKVSLKTIQRDVKDLNDASLIDVHFSKKVKGYAWRDPEERYLRLNEAGCFPPPCLGQNQARNRHLLKLNRLATIVWYIKNEDIPFYEKLGYEDEEDYQWAMEDPAAYLSYNDSFPEKNENMHYYTYVDWYQETFPECSRSTMYRDFNDLRKMGLTIGYNEVERCYQHDFTFFYSY
ncbi:hypothetical protein [uncultured Acetobacterium sp.]|uniref:hypothetical protein n=1 Tax=uncultured Acetobacterium sp. TaxID=217139 RepID=UPI0025D7BFCA|nr:hypothetical protein [uncultured Acetobacterium sp.]